MKKKDYLNDKYIEQNQKGKIERNSMKAMISQTDVMAFFFLTNVI